MKQDKLHYNSLLRKYMKNVRRLHSLRATNRNERRQKILTKHIERLQEKLQSLIISLKRGVVASGIAIAAVSMIPESANAQSFGSMQTNPFSLQGVGGSGFSNPTLGDIDGDGDLDMISGQFYYDYYYYSGYGNFMYYENTGTAANPSFAAPQTNPFGLSALSQFEGISPTLVDLDGDGDLDIMLNDNSGTFRYYENTGTSAAPAFAAPVNDPFSLSLNIFGSGNSQPSFADLDNDADLDLIIGRDNNSELIYFENTGTVTNPVFGAGQTNPFSIVPTISPNNIRHPKFIDIDGDGDFDILAGTYNYDGDFNTPDGKFVFFENTGTSSAPVFAAEVVNPFGLTGPTYGFGLDVADIDADGDLDIIAGEDYYYAENFMVWEGCTPTTNTITTSEVCEYTAPSGAVYVASGTYVDVIPNATNCDSVITINLTIDPISDISFTDNAIDVCENSAAALELSSSQNNLNYYLRNDLNDTVVDGPIVGDGNTISFNTGNLTTSTTYNVYAEKPVPSTGLLVDGQSDYADASNISLDNASFTIEFWAKRANTGNDDYVIAQGSSTGNNGLHIGYRGSNQITFAFFGNDLNTTNSFTSTDWHHIAVTYDNTTGDRTIYVDGNQEETDNSASAYTGTGNLRIGSTPWAGFGSGDGFEGSIDEVRIWSTVRTQTEIMDNMDECLTGTETDLISYYQFEEGTGTVASDETANGNDATLSGDATWGEGSSVCSTCNIVMSQTATVSVTPAPTVNVPAGDEEVCIGETVNISPATGGTWVSSDPAVATITNTGEVNGLTAGTVDMTFTDGITGCTNEPGTATITVNPDPIVNIPAGDEEICIGEMVNITPATGGSWASSDVTVATITNAGEVDGLTIGSVDMTFTDGTTGCSNDAGTASITVNPNPTVNIPAGDEEICIGEIVNITPATGGTWASSDAAIATITNTGDVEGVTAGSVDMTFTDGTTGCSNDAGTASITVNPNPTVNIPAGDEEICIGETVNITPSTGGTWMSSDATVATITNTGDVEGVTAGAVDMTFTDGTTGCSNDAGTASITVNPNPTVNIPAGDEEICIGEMVNITPATGGTWASSDAAIATITNTGEVDGISAGTADMTFTDGTTGCSNELGTASITVNPALDVTVTNNTTSLTANATGASYQWLDCDDNNSVISGATSQTFTPTSNGNYAVEITENGCSDTSDCEAITVLSIDENAFGANINIYPNPTKGIINIDLGQDKSANLKLVSVQGREIFSKDVNESNVTVDISRYPQGVYILRISEGKNESFHRIIKN